MDEEFPIVRIEPNGPVRKDLSHKHAPFEVSVKYVLEDGRTFAGSERFRLRRDATRLADTLPAAPRHTMRAILRDGQFRGTVMTFSL